jgi:hypothetical protein
MSKPEEQNAQQPKHRPTYNDTLPTHNAQIQQSYRHMLVSVALIVGSLYAFSTEMVLMVIFTSLSGVLLIDGIFDNVQGRLRRRDWNAMEQRTCVVTDRFFCGSGFVPASGNSSNVTKADDGKYLNLEAATLEYYLEVKDTSTGMTRWLYVDQATFDAHPQDGFYRFPANAEQKTAEGTSDPDETEEHDDEQDTDTTVEQPAGGANK